VGTGLVELIGGLLTAGIAFFLLIKINATLTILAVVFFPIFAVIIKLAFSKVRPMFRERGAIWAEVSGRLTESLAGVRIVKGFHAEEREAAAFAGGAGRLFDMVRKTMIANSVIGFSSTLLMGLVSITIMVVGGRMLVRGTMTIGEFFAFSLYMGFLVAPVFKFVGIGSQ